jgi:hypothetical protein
VRSYVNERGNRAERDNLGLPFGYYLERDADLMILHRPDLSLVAVFSAEDMDPFEVELAVWEDAD